MDGSKHVVYLQVVRTQPQYKKSHPTAPGVAEKTAPDHSCQRSGCGTRDCLFSFLMRSCLAASVNTIFSPPLPTSSWFLA